ncbi:uncharacterized protein [Oscarella lobularis]|uniref:uncharacterized protein isoform X6 n=1 Tax=Oscarella lobularis TaxID=121494 RepID=UPI003313731D
MKGGEDVQSRKEWEERGQDQGTRGRRGTSKQGEGGISRDRRFFRCIGMGGTRTRARDAREKEEQAIKKMKEYQGIDDVEECKEEGYEQGTRVGRTEK